VVGVALGGARRLLPRFKGLSHGGHSGQDGCWRLGRTFATSAIHTRRSENRCGSGGNRRSARKMHEKRFSLQKSGNGGSVAAGGCRWLQVAAGGSKWQSFESFCEENGARVNVPAGVSAVEVRARTHLTVKTVAVPGRNTRNQATSRRHDYDQRMAVGDANRRN